MKERTEAANRLRANARSLRKNMTKEERRLWYEFLKDLPVQVRRQHMIDCYIVDFYCAAAKLVIELDGSQHYDPAGQAKDRDRDRYLRSRGLEVARYSNLDIAQNFSGVCEDILRRIAASKPSPYGADSPYQGEMSRRDKGGRDRWLAERDG